MNRELAVYSVNEGHVLDLTIRVPRRLTLPSSPVIRAGRCTRCELSAVQKGLLGWARCHAVASIRQCRLSSDCGLHSLIYERSLSARKRIGFSCQKVQPAIPQWED